MADDTKLGERIAKLEANVKTLKELCEDRERDSGAILSKLETIDKELSRYRGIVGGVLFVVTALVTFAKLFGEQIAGLFTD